MPDLFSASSREPGLAAQFARAGRMAVAGLILPPALLSAASMLGHPVRSDVEAIAWVSALAGFAAAGWMSGRRLSASPAVALRTAGAFAAGGALVTPAFRALQGLSGREPILAVIASTMGGFALGFGLAGTATAAVAGVRGGRLRGAARLSVLAGILGGLLALLPFGSAHLGLTGTLAGYGQMAAAVVAMLGCIIAPCRVIGRALAAALTDMGPDASS
jgi:hypothetical protein